jgi:hypothetical protein
MLGWIREKMATLESALGGGGFSTSGSTIVGNGTSTCSDSCVPSKDCLTVTGNNFWDNAHTFDPHNRGKRLGGEPSTLVQCTQHMGGSLDG